MSQLVSSHPKMVVGAGTVLSTDIARLCLDSGASFITAPSFNLKIVEFAAKENIAVLPGALTPTEVVTAWEAGSDFVKVFPCSLVGGERYIKALKTSLTRDPLDRGRRRESADGRGLHRFWSQRIGRRHRIDSRPKPLSEGKRNEFRNWRCDSESL